MQMIDVSKLPLRFAAEAVAATRGKLSAHGIALPVGI
jgi:hypothetical protein